MKEGLIKDTYELIIKEIQTIISVSYVFIVGVGMLFNYQKYSEFDINIFSYSDVFDFLIAPFGDVYILLFSTASIVFVAVLFKLDSLWKNKRPKSYTRFNFKLNKKPWFNAYRLVLFSGSVILYLALAADYYGKYAKKRVLEGGTTSVVFTDNDVKSGKLIGKTKDVVFLLSKGSVLAIPINSSVKEIKISTFY